MVHEDVNIVKLVQFKGLGFSELFNVQQYIVVPWRPQLHEKTHKQQSFMSIPYEGYLIPETRRVH
jgi:hypothetical protein